MTVVLVLEKRNVHRDKNSAKKLAEKKNIYLCHKFEQLT